MHSLPYSAPGLSSCTPTDSPPCRSQSDSFKIPNEVPCAPAPSVLSDPHQFHSSLCPLPALGAWPSWPSLQCSCPDLMAGSPPQSSLCSDLFPTHPSLTTVLNKGTLISGFSFSLHGTSHLLACCDWCTFCCLHCWSPGPILCKEGQLSAVATSAATQSTALRRALAWFNSLLSQS